MPQFPFSFFKSANVPGTLAEITKWTVPAANLFNDPIVQKTQITFSAASTYTPGVLQTNLITTVSAATMDQASYGDFQAGFDNASGIPHGDLLSYSIDCTYANNISFNGDFYGYILYNSGDTLAGEGDASAYIWFTINGLGDDPGTWGVTGSGTLVELTSGWSESQVASAIAGATGGSAAGATVSFSGFFCGTNGHTGAVITDHGANMDAVHVTGGTNGPSPAPYFLVNDPNGFTYYVWVAINSGPVDGIGAQDPLAGDFGAYIQPSLTDNSFSVASQAATALQSLGFGSAGSAGNAVTWNSQTIGGGQTISDGGASGATTYVQATVGSWGAYFTTPEGVGIVFNVDGGTYGHSGLGTEIQVSLAGTDTATQVATKVKNAMNGVDGYTVTNSSNTFSYKNLIYGYGSPLDGAIPSLTNFTFAISVAEVSPPFIYINDPTNGTYSSFFLLIDGQSFSAFGTPYGIAALSTDTAAQVATKVFNYLNGQSKPITNPSSGVIVWTFQWSIGTSFTNPTFVNIGSTSFLSAQNPSASAYFRFNDPTLGQFYVYAAITRLLNNFYIDPAPGGTGVRFAANANTPTTANNIAIAIKNAINAAISGTHAVSSTNTVTFTNPNLGPVADSTQSTTPAVATSGFSITIIQQGA